jgi:hypothetical protein
VPITNTCACAQLGRVNSTENGSKTATIVNGRAGTGGTVWRFGRHQTIPLAPPCRQPLSRRLSLSGAALQAPARLAKMAKVEVALLCSNYRRLIGTDLVVPDADLSQAGALYHSSLG